MIPVEEALAAVLALLRPGASDPAALAQAATARCLGEM